MDDMILTKARELGMLIANSPAFTSLRELEAAATADQDVSDLYDQYADLREKMEEIQGSAQPDAAAFAKLRTQLMDVETRLSQQPRMAAVSESRDAFNALMDGINRAIQEELGTYVDEDEEYGSSCGSGGCASCAGCGGH